MSNLLIIFTLWESFANLAKFLLWMIGILILLWIVIFLLQEVFNLIGFSLKKIGILVLSILGIYTIFKKITKYLEKKGYKLTE